jgi:hypothetical protein
MLEGIIWGLGGLALGVGIGLIVRLFAKRPSQSRDLPPSFLDGQGRPKNLVKAVVWYRKAAEQGDASAMFNLGIMYDHGRGVPQDYAQAALWYRKAAEQGFAAAQYNLGVAYHEGQGVPQDDVQAAAWYRKAAEQGDATAQFSLGLACYYGEGVHQDFAEANYWLSFVVADKTEGIDLEYVAKLRDDAASHVNEADLVQTVEDSPRRFEEHVAQDMTQRQPAANSIREPVDGPNKIGGSVTETEGVQADPEGETAQYREKSAGLTVGTEDVWICPKCNVVVASPLISSKMKRTCPLGHQVEKPTGFFAGLIGVVGAIIVFALASHAVGWLWNVPARLLNAFTVGLGFSFLPLYFFVKGIHSLLMARPARRLAGGYLGMMLGGAIIGVVIEYSMATTWDAAKGRPDSVSAGVNLICFTPDTPYFTESDSERVYRFFLPYGFMFGSGCE